ncbi:MAG TPA: dihydrofolate reductase family protein [Gaiellaceae bacterium]|nr:dihydrofolate reductase family protein [Gaiellaceae bacterium]
MRKLVESTFVTLDGVISDPQVWGSPYWDEEHAAYARELLFSSDLLLLGRKTYEGFAQVWPERSGDEYTDRINAMPKVVASRTLTEAAWNATILGGDVVEEVAKLKAEPGQGILKFGTGELDRPLLANGLVDELHLWVFPVLAGAGQSLIEGIEPTHLELVGTTRFASGIVVHTYAPK